MEASVVGDEGQPCTFQIVVSTLIVDMESGMCMIVLLLLWWFQILTTMQIIINGSCQYNILHYLQSPIQYLGMIVRQTNAIQQYNIAIGMIVRQTNAIQQYNILV